MNLEKEMRGEIDYKIDGIHPKDAIKVALKYGEFIKQQESNQQYSTMKQDEILPTEQARSEVKPVVMPKPEILYPALRYIFDLTYQTTPDLSTAISQIASIRAIALIATEYAELPDDVKKYWEQIKDRFTA